MDFQQPNQQQPNQQQINQQPDQNIQPNPVVVQPPKNIWKIVALTIIGILILGSVSYGAYYWWPKNNKPVACTQEAKQCPDGSSVGRTGPNCEFASCPEAKTDEAANWQTYRNDSFRFEFKYPVGWQLKTGQSGDQNIITVRDQEKGYAGNDYIVLMINYVPNQGGITIDEWWAEVGKNSGYKKTGETTIVSRRALVLGMTESEAGPRYIFTSQDRAGFIFDISTTGLSNEIINQILSTFKFTK